MYGSSWFYQKSKATPATSFPTIQEQVQMCRQIASQLVDDQNAKSKGASMFFKRVKRSQNWEVKAPLQVDIQAAIAPTPDVQEEAALREKLKQTMLSPGGTPLYKVMDPRGKTLSIENINPSAHVTHDKIPAAVCSRLVQDMQSPEASPRAAALFLARKLKAAEWEAQADQRRERIVAHRNGTLKSNSDAQEYPALYASAFNRQQTKSNNRYSCSFEYEQQQRIQPQPLYQPSRAPAMAPKWAPPQPVPAFIPTQPTPAPQLPATTTVGPAAAPQFSLLAQQQNGASPGPSIRQYNSYNSTPKSWTAFKQQLASVAS